MTLFMRLGALITALILPLSLAAQDDTTQLFLDGYCTAEALDAERCACAQAAFADATAETDPGVANVMAFFLGQPGMDPNEMLTAMQSLDQSKFQAAIMQSMSLDLLAICPDAAATVPDLDLAGLSPHERYVLTCVDGDEELRAPCTCAADRLQENLDPLEFELLVDIRVAEYQGADDGFAVVAEDRGLTREEAEEALMASRGSLMAAAGAIMGCMSEIPGFEEMMQSMPSMGN